MAISLELGETPTDQRVVEFGVTVLSSDLEDYVNVEVIAQLNNGDRLTASRPILEAAGEGDTFFGFTAPPGTYIEGFELNHEGTGNFTFLSFNDIGFRTAAVGQRRLQARPVIDAQTTSDFSNVFDGSGDVSVQMFRSGTEVLGVMEFDIGSMAHAQSVESAMLEFDIVSSERAGQSGWPVAEVYAYRGDGLATNADRDVESVLVGVSHEVISGKLAIDLETSFLESLVDSQYLGFLIRPGNPANEVRMSFATSESAWGGPTLTVDFTPGNPRGDFDGDFDLDLDDIDLLLGQGNLLEGIVAVDATFDMDNDGILDQRDIDEWLSSAGEANGLPMPLRLGDANLDGIVDPADLNVVGQSWESGSRLWSSGDFNGDGRVNALDLNKLAINWLADSSVAAVPEPSQFHFLCCLIAAVAIRKRVRRCE